MSKQDEESKPSLIANWLVKKPDRYILPKMKLPIFIKELKRQGRLEVVNELQKGCELIRKKAYLGTVGLSQNEQVIDDVFVLIEKLKAEK